MLILSYSQFHLSWLLWDILHSQFIAPLDSRRRSFYIAICWICHLCRLPRLPLTGFFGIRHSTNTFSDQPFRTWACGWQSFLWRCIYCIAVRSGRGCPQRRLAAAECFHRLHRDRERPTCPAGHFCYFCWISGGTNRRRPWKCLRWRCHHHPRHVLSMRFVYGRWSHIA